MSLHKVFCQPVTKHVIGDEVRSSGFTFHRNVKDRNAFFDEVNKKYDSDHEKAKRSGHQLEFGYTYLEPTSELEPFYGFIDDATFNQLQELNKQGKPPHFPDVEPTR